MNDIKIDGTVTSVAIVAAAATFITLISSILTLSKERANLRQAEIAMRATLLKQMAEATAVLVSDCRLIVARQAANRRTQNAPELEVPDFRTARKDWLIADTGIRAQLAAYLSHVGSNSARKKWTRLSRALNYYNLIVEPAEPARTKYVQDIIEYVQLGEWSYLSGMDLGALHNPIDEEYDHVYHRVGAALIDSMFPIAQSIVSARRSPVYRLKIIRR